MKKLGKLKRLVSFRFYLTLIFAVSTLSLSGIAQSAPIVNYDAISGYATGIDNLDVGGAVYDVAFVEGSFNAVFSISLPTFLGDLAGANNAADAIMAALNAEALVPEINASPNEVLWTPFIDGAGSFSATQVGHNISSAPWQRYANFVGDKTVAYAPWYFAVYTTDVPEPGILGLFSLSIIALFIRRKTLLR